MCPPLSLQPPRLSDPQGQGADSSPQTTCSFPASAQPLTPVGPWALPSRPQDGCEAGEQWGWGGREARLRLDLWSHSSLSTRRASWAKPSPESQLPGG